VGAFFCGCAAKKHEPSQKRLPPSGSERGDVIRPIGISPPSEITTPERRASMGLVKLGTAQLDADSFELAMATFRDAINIDSTNGIAYYYLALTYHYLDQPELASGLLDKAEHLLKNDADWMQKVLELRKETGAQAPPTYRKPVEYNDGDGF
jgi:tetratricopeptide (TPR) repeat protein